MAEPATTSANPLDSLCGSACDTAFFLRHALRAAGAGDSRSAWFNLGAAHAEIDHIELHVVQMRALDLFDAVRLAIEARHAG